MFAIYTKTTVAREKALLADHMNKCLIVLNVTERLPVFTDDIIAAINTGESYETLVRRLKALSAEIDKLAALAREAKLFEFASNE